MWIAQTFGIVLKQSWDSVGIVLKKTTEHFQLIPNNMGNETILYIPELARGLKFIR